MLPTELMIGAEELSMTYNYEQLESIRELIHYTKYNVFFSERSKLEKFRDMFAEVRPKRLFAEYEARKVHGKLIAPSAPTKLDFVGHDYKLNSYYGADTGFDCPYPAEKAKVLSEIVEGILLLAQARSIPLIKGSIAFKEDWGSGEEGLLFFSVDPYGLAAESSDGAEMKISLEQWLTALQEDLSAKETKVVYHFDRLNKREHWQDDSGKRTSSGYFSLDAVSKMATFTFSGYALPIAKQLLQREDLSFPLPERESQQLQKAILGYLEPLYQKGYNVQPWKSPYDK